MSTLTRTNSHSKKPQYKDYVSFLDNYRHGKKDDQNSVITSDSGVNFSLSNSSNNSSNSVFSDVSDAAPKNGYKGYSENSHRINSTVNSELSKSKEQQRAAVKTEVFIEIKNPSVMSNYKTTVFEVQNVDKPQETIISVSNAAKIFEKNSQNSKGGDSLKPTNSFSKKLSIGEISKKFENGSQLSKSNKSPPKKAASIGEVSKMFENNNGENNGTLRRARNFNAVPKPFQAITSPKLNTEIKANPLSPKPAILSPKPVLSAPQFNKFSQDFQGPQADSVDSAFSSLSISPSPPQSVSPPPVLFSTPSSGPSLPPPPPPPLPPAGFASKSVTNKYVLPPSSQNEVTHQKPAQNGTGVTQSVKNGGATQKITIQTNEVPQQNGGTLNRNDPRVKKAVYGALRNMYGAYHDQANDYLATLPKNRVKKNNGLDNIINSIASQGGLDKLNGRANPNPEVE